MMPSNEFKLAEYLKKISFENHSGGMLEIPVFIEFNDSHVGFYIRFNIDEETGQVENRPQAVNMHYPGNPTKSPYYYSLIDDLEKGSRSQIRQAFVKKMKEMGFAGYLAYRTVNRITITDDTRSIRVQPSSDLLGIVSLAYDYRLATHEDT